MKPVPLTKAELVAILKDMLARVDAGDSLEGSLEYMLPDTEELEDTDFVVSASYRTGNLEGQGGMRMVGKF